MSQTVDYTTGEADVYEVENASSLPKENIKRSILKTFPYLNCKLKNTDMQ